MGEGAVVGGSGVGIDQAHGGARPLLLHVPAVRELPLHLLAVRADDDAVRQPTVQDRVRRVRELPGQRITPLAVQRAKSLVHDQRAGPFADPPMERQRHGQRDPELLAAR